MKNGIINIYKEAGMTSFQVVYRIRKITGEQKVGHTGTLDPDVTGVLPVCIGKACKLVDFLMDTDKQYKAVMVLGKSTDTQDISGRIIKEDDPELVKRRISEKFDGNDFEVNIKKAFKHFTGEIEQLPPMYSAVKVNGVKLVDAARKGCDIERRVRKVKIYKFSDIKPDMDNLNISFTVDCSKGTYIRTLCEDIGKFFGVGACMKSLERTRASMLELESSVTLGEIEEAQERGQLEDLIIPTEEFLKKYPGAVISPESVNKIIYGNYLLENEVRVSKINSEDGIYRMYDEAGKFYALYRFDSNDSVYKCEKMFL